MGRGGKISPFVHFYLAFAALGAFLLALRVEGVSQRQQFGEENGLFLCEFDEKWLPLRGDRFELLREGGVVHDGLHSITQLVLLIFINVGQFKT